MTPQPPDQDEDRKKKRYRKREVPKEDMDKGKDKNTKKERKTYPGKRGRKSKEEETAAVGGDHPQDPRSDGPGQGETSSASGGDLAQDPTRRGQGEAQWASGGGLAQIPRRRGPGRPSLASGVDHLQDTRRDGQWEASSGSWSTYVQEPTMRERVGQYSTLGRQYTQYPRSREQWGRSSASGGEYSQGPRREGGMETTSASWETYAEDPRMRRQAGRYPGLGGEYSHDSRGRGQWEPSSASGGEYLHDPRRRAQSATRVSTETTGGNTFTYYNSSSLPYASTATTTTSIFPRPLIAQSHGELSASLGTSAYTVHHFGDQSQPNPYFPHLYQNQGENLRGQGPIAGSSSSSSGIDPSGSGSGPSGSGSGPSGSGGGSNSPSVREILRSRYIKTEPEEVSTPETFPVSSEPEPRQQDQDPQYESTFPQQQSEEQQISAFSSQIETSSSSISTSATSKFHVAAGHSDNSSNINLNYIVNGNPVAVTVREVQAQSDSQRGSYQPISIHRLYNRGFWNPSNYNSSVPTRPPVIQFPSVSGVSGQVPGEQIPGFSISPVAPTSQTSRVYQSGYYSETTSSNFQNNYSYSDITITALLESHNQRKRPICPYPCGPEVLRNYRPIQELGPVIPAFPTDETSGGNWEIETTSSTQPTTTSPSFGITTSNSTTTATETRTSQSHTTTPATSQQPESSTPEAAGSWQVKVLKPKFVGSQQVKPLKPKFVGSQHLKSLIPEEASESQQVKPLISEEVSDNQQVKPLIIEEASESQQVQQLIIEEASESQQVQPLISEEASGSQQFQNAVALIPEVASIPEEIPEVSESQQVEETPKPEATGSGESKTEDQRKVEDFSKLNCLSSLACEVGKLDVGIREQRVEEILTRRTVAGSSTATGPQDKAEKKTRRSSGNKPGPGSGKARKSPPKRGGKPEDMVSSKNGSALRKEGLPYQIPRRPHHPPPTTLSNEEEGEVLDLRKPSSEKLCLWCSKRPTLVENGVDSNFCSEKCFHMYRRESYKKRSSCLWCSKNPNERVYPPGGIIDESRFCSHDCVRSYKMHIFREETYANLEQFKAFQAARGISMPSVSGPGNDDIVILTQSKHRQRNDLITPELWISQPQPQGHGSKKKVPQGPGRAPERSPNETPIIIPLSRVSFSPVPSSESRFRASPVPPNLSLAQVPQNMDPQRIQQIPLKHRLYPRLQNDMLPTGLPSRRRSSSGRGNDGKDNSPLDRSPTPRGESSSGIPKKRMRLGALSPSTGHSSANPDRNYRYRPQLGMDLSSLQMGAAISAMTGIEMSHPLNLHQSSGGGSRGQRISETSVNAPNTDDTCNSFNESEIARALMMPRQDQHQQPGPRPGQGTHGNDGNWFPNQRNGPLVIPPLRFSGPQQGRSLGLPHFSGGGLMIPSEPKSSTSLEILGPQMHIDTCHFLRLSSPQVTITNPSGEQIEISSGISNQSAAETSPDDPKPCSSKTAMRQGGFSTPHQNPRRNDAKRETKSPKPSKLPKYKKSSENSSSNNQTGNSDESKGAEPAIESPASVSPASTNSAQTNDGAEDKMEKTSSQSKTSFRCNHLPPMALFIPFVLPVPFPIPVICEHDAMNKDNQNEESNNAQQGSGHEIGNGEQRASQENSIGEQGSDNGEPRAIQENSNGEQGPSQGSVNGEPMDIQENRNSEQGPAPGSDNSEPRAIQENSNGEQGPSQGSVNGEQANQENSNGEQGPGPGSDNGEPRANQENSNGEQGPSQGSVNGEPKANQEQSNGEQGRDHDSMKDEQGSIQKSNNGEIVLSQQKSNGEKDDSQNRNGEQHPCQNSNKGEQGSSREDKGEQETGHEDKREHGTDPEDKGEEGTSQMNNGEQGQSQQIQKVTGALLILTLLISPQANAEMIDAKMEDANPEDEIDADLLAVIDMSIRECPLNMDVPCNPEQDCKDANEKVPEPEEPSILEEKVPEPEEPSVPAENVPEPEEPRAPEETIPEPEEPSVPEEKVPEPEEPSVPEEKVPEPEEPSVPEEKVPEPEEPSVPEETIPEPEQPSVLEDTIHEDIESSEDEKIFEEVYSSEDEKVPAPAPDDGSSSDEMQQIEQFMKNYAAEVMKQEKERLEAEKKEEDEEIDVIGGADEIETSENSAPTEIPRNDSNPSTRTGVQVVTLGLPVLNTRPGGKKEPEKET